MVERMRMVPWLILSIFTVAGCLTDSGLEQEEFPYELHIKTSFVPEKSSPAAMVPEGSPAAGMRLLIGERTPIEPTEGPGTPSSDSWEYDSSCPLRGEPGRESFDCEDHPVRERVRLPPISEDLKAGDFVVGLAYPLTRNGDIVLLSKEPFSAGLRHPGPYSENLLELRTNPDDSCRETVKTEGHEGVRGIEASVDSANRTIVHFDQSGEITLLWWGYCHEERNTVE